MGLVFVLRGKEFEASISKKENCIKDLEGNLQEQSLVNIRQQNEIKLLNERLTNEVRRVKTLEREGDQLRSEIALLEAKVGLQFCEDALILAANVVF